MPETQANTAARRSRVIVLLAYEGCQSLDVTGPWEVFTKAAQFSAREGQAPAYRLILASPSGGTVRCNSGLSWADSVPIAELRGSIDTLLVAGGDEQAFDTGGTAHALLPWLRRKARVVRRVGSVCTGAFALAGAGLLEGRRATTHWRSCAALARQYPGIALEPDAIFVADPPFYSSAGISAAIDLALALVEADLGQAVALAVARDLVLYLRRPGGQSQFSAGLQAQTRASHRFRDLLSWMHEHPQADLGVAELAQRVAMSERHFARQFRQETGQTPARFVEAMRLDCAKSHLEQTPWPLARVAHKAGFGSVDSLQRSLKRHAGITPEQYRQRFSRQA